MEVNQPSSPPQTGKQEYKAGRKAACRSSEDLLEQA